MAASRGVLPSAGALDDQRAELAQQASELQRISQLRKQRLAEVAEERELELQNARSEIGRLRAALREAAEADRGRSSQLASYERESIEMQVQTQEIEAQVEIARIRAQTGNKTQCDRLSTRIDVELHTIQELQKQLASEEEECREADLACRACSSKRAASMQEFTSSENAILALEESTLELRIQEMTCQLANLGAVDRNQSPEHQEMEQACERVRVQLVQSEQEIGTLAHQVSQLEESVEASRQEWLDAERTGINVTNDLESVTMSHDRVLGELRLQTVASGKLIAARMAIGAEVARKLEAEHATWQADRRLLQDEELQVQNMYANEANQIRHRYEVEMQEQVAHIEARSRRVMLVGQHCAEERLIAAQSDTNRRFIEERKSSEDRLMQIRRAVAEEVDERSEEEAALMQKLADLEEDLVSARLAAENVTADVQHTEAQLHDCYNGEIPGVRSQLQDKEAESGSLKRQLEQVGSAWASDKERILAEIKSQRRRVVDMIVADASSMHEFDDDLPEIPSIPDLPLDGSFGSGSIGVASPSNRGGVESGRRQLDENEMHVELNKCAHRIEEFKDIAQLLSGGITRLRIKEDELTALDQECTLLRQRSMNLQTDVQRATQERDHLQDLSNDLRSRLQHAAMGSHLEKGNCLEIVDAVPRVESNRVEVAQMELKRLVEHNRSLLTELRRVTASVPRPPSEDTATRRSRNASPLSLVGRAADLSPARPPLTVSERSTESQRRKMKAMQLRKQELEAKREVDARDRLRVGWGLPL